MAAAEPGELGAIEALRADRQAPDPGPDESRRIAALVRPGIGLEGDLRVVRQPEASPDVVDQSSDDLSRQQGRRAAADVEGFEGRTTGRVDGRPRARRPKGLVERTGSQVNLGLEGIRERVNSVARSARSRSGIDDEVAIRADRDAEGNVDIERDRRRGTVVGERLGRVN